ncbi:MAG: DUF4982 domain-containing protein [Paludibacter sp.]|nr:DUF4982 domain-containing protein [Paludibacter sp.]
MTKKNIVLVLFMLLVVQVNAAPAFKGNIRTKYNFNPQWLLHVGDSQKGGKDFADPNFADKNWKSVDLPRAFNEDEAYRVAIDEHTDTIVWYRKHFRLPRTAKGQKIFLEFEGIRFGGEFWINGKAVGMHENGVMAFGLDITEYVNYSGDNVLAIRIDNSWRYRERATNSTYQWNDRNFNANYGGIPKNVFLHVTSGVYQTLPLYSNLGTTGTYIYAREINISKKNAMIYAESELKNESGKDQTLSFEVMLEDMEGKIVKQFGGSEVQIKKGETKTVKAGALVENLHFWSWGYGYLYNVYTVLKLNGMPVDVVKTRTGFRKTAFRDGMFLLNDRVLQLKGYAQRTSNEWPSVGMSVPPWLSDYSNGLIVKGNGNLVRWMHVTPWKQDVESCDRVGLIQAMPAGDAEKDVTGRRWEHRTALMRDAIIYNRNNPSVIFYEGGNESISEAHMAELKAIRDSFDLYGGRAMGSREMLDSRIAEWGGEMLYINKSAKHPMWATEYLRDEGLRKYWDNYSYPFHKDGEGSKYYRSTVTNEVTQRPDATAYNRNQNSFFVETIVRWYDYFRVRPGTGKRVSSGGANIIFSDSNTHYRGAENYRRSGEVDAMRIAKDAFFAHMVMWNGWVDIENHSSYIAGHWEAPFNAPEAGKPATRRDAKDVLVVSTGEKVELWVNGKSQGFGERSHHFLFTFRNVKYEAGVIEAVSYDAKGNELHRSKKETTGVADRINLTLMQAPDGFKADGADLVMVEVEVVDRDGRRCPLANDMISFDLKGQADWRGGIAQGKEGNYILDKVLPVEAGVNRVLIRATRKAGKVQLTASAEGLKTGTLSFSSKAVSVQDGLSTYISGEQQPSNLSRGATPEGSSFKVTRQNVEVIAATAGSNEADVTNSFDDNELSEWKNDGRLSSGWIKYELERDATIGAADLKLTGWRMRSYPVQIFVDDVKVWEGDTEKSLGYIHLQFKPTRGRFVTIKLTGASADKDAFGGIVEVAAATAGELDLFKDPNAARADGQLRIVEAEFFEEN